MLFIITYIVQLHATQAFIILFNKIQPQYMVSTKKWATASSSAGIKVLRLYLNWITIKVYRGLEPYLFLDTV